MWNEQMRTTADVEGRGKDPKLIIVPLVDSLTTELYDILDEFFNHPEFCLLHTEELKLNQYYQIGKYAASICRKQKFQDYYLLAHGPPALIMIISVKMYEAIGNYKCIEIQPSLTEEKTIRSLDVP